MSGVHRLFGNNLSVIKDGVLTPSSVKTSSDIFTTETRRKGSGTAFLMGNYTGLDDAVFELRVSSGEGVGRITQPVFVGAGTGILSGLGISGVGLQDFAIRLIDLGIDTLNAEFDMGDVVLKAKSSGAAGNGILATVNESELIFTETAFATLEAIAEGTIEFKGPQWDWGTVVLNARGEIPSEGMRLKFENDPQIYRQYKIRAASDWVYYLSPGAVRAIPEGSKIYEVTGHRRVTITDGIVTEQYPHVVTLYDFAVQARAISDLIEVVGVVVDDKTPGGMNCQDFPFVTDAYMHPIKMEGSKYVQRLDDIELQAAVNTEILEIECIGDAEMGSEAWSVEGSVTGALPGVRTAEPYIYGPVHFTIPEKLLDYQEPVGSMGFEVNYISRDEGEAEPPICLERRVLGVRAKTGSVIFTWTKNVTLEGCECDSASVSGFVSAECLGLEELNGGDMGELDPEYKSRLEGIYNYIDEYTQDNTYFYDEISDKKGWCVTATEVITHAGDVVSRIKVTFEYETEEEANNQADYLSSYSKASPTGRRTYEDIKVERIYNYVGGAETDLKFMHAAKTILLSTLVQIYFESSALVIWDSLWAEIQVDLNNFIGVFSKDPGNEVRHITVYGQEFLQRYQAKANLALLAAGIVPGKSRSSSGGAGCWSERPDTYYWRAGDGYLPAYNNVVYHSVKLNAEGEVYSTKEFAFAIVCACPQHLKVGDQVTVEFDSRGNQVNTYQLGDKFSIPIIGAKDLELSGGIDGDDTHTWQVEGDTPGAFPDYLSIAGAEAEYAQNGLQFLIERGGIPFELGDQWTFSVEGGKFRWRKDNGAWSADLDIGSQDLSDGISAVFIDGPAPSFEPGDLFRFKVTQPNSAEHIKQPTAERWTWVGSSGTLTIDCGGSVSVSEIFVADHDIPSTATVLIEGSQDGFVTTDWSEAMAWNDAVLAKVLVASVTVTHLRLKVTNADDCYIGWVCAGVGLTTILFPALTLSRKYASITGGSMLAGSSIPMGAGWAGQLNWENSISQAELLELIILLDYLKENNNEPVILLPHILHEEEGKLCRIDTDDVEITDVFDFQPDAQAKRIQSVTIPLEPVYL